MTPLSNPGSGAHGVNVSLEDGMSVATVAFPNHSEYYITAPMGPEDTADSLFERIARWLEKKKATVVSQDVFGLPRAAGHESLREALPARDWPVTWIEEGAEALPHLAGTQVWAVDNLPVSPVYHGGEVAGRFFEDEHLRLLRVGGTLPEKAEAPNNEQAQNLFDQFCGTLEGKEMGFADVVRTWFYNDAITAWYDDFNVVRRNLFEAWGVYDRLVPASTGIGAANGTGAALTGGLIALGYDPEVVRAFPVASPLQCPAIDYGSAFSRAVEVDAPDHRRLFLSGTASIEPGGETVHLDDIDGQIDLTFRVAHAILESRDMDWSNVVRLLVYLKDATYIESYRAYIQANGLANVPALPVKTDICRDDLLFEIEFDAIAPK